MTYEQFLALPASQRALLATFVLATRTVVMSEDQAQPYQADARALRAAGLAWRVSFGIETAPEGDVFTVEGFPTDVAKGFVTRAVQEARA